MITTADLAGSFDDLVLRKAACPICLSKLLHSPGDGRLLCSFCNSGYYTLSGLPVFLVQDENQRMKEDEVKGELEYNAKKIPPEVHEQRNTFVNRNSQLFLDEYPYESCRQAGPRGRLFHGGSRILYHDDGSARVPGYRPDAGRPVPPGLHRPEDSGCVDLRGRRMPAAGE